MSEEEREAISPARMKELEAAKDLINSASREEKQQLFLSPFGELENYKASLEQPENRMDPHSSIAVQANDRLYIYISRLTGYKLGWISDKMLKHYKAIGRPETYNYDTRQVNCYFIEQMVKRGASPRQAMRLLARLRGDTAMSEGLLRELRETYNHYIALSTPETKEDRLIDNSFIIADFLAFSIEHLEDSEEASKLAVKAFRSFFAELIDFMTEYHFEIIQLDRGNLEIYGNLFQWLSEAYDDPLDYFYSHPSHKTDSLIMRKSWLQNYLNSIGNF